ncbi:N-acetylmuramoyl-L-alanine amidase [Tsukamurella soli]|uniref:Rv3717 family N-acetylmuramoyl-L-alanine amidase n=1 Tax=Tsukamurella soli TaxID=644556 RepID=A0ABP8J7N7_9ACTN
MKAQRIALLAASTVPAVVLTGCTISDATDRSQPATHTTLSLAAPSPVAADATLSRQVPTGRGGTRDCNTTGTAGDDGFPEHTLDWNVADRLYKLLETQGVQVAFSRPDDASVGPCVDVRAQTADSWDADAAVSIHADGTAATDHGFHVNLSSPPTVLVECGNMRNSADEAVLNSADGQQRTAQALADGLAAFLSRR